MPLASHAYTATAPSALPPDALLTALNGAMLDLDDLEDRLELATPAWSRASAKVDALAGCLPTVAPSTPAEALAMLAAAFCQASSREVAAPSPGEDRRTVGLLVQVMEASLPTIIAALAPRGAVAQHAAIVGHAMRLGRDGELA